MKQWMLYGATGYTGALIAAEAVQKGYRPLLAGRSAEKLACLAEKLNLDWCAFSLQDTAALHQAIQGVDLVLHAAGPFQETAAPMLDACVKGRTHYLDIANEIPVIQSVKTHDAAARAQGITLVSGVGFGAAAADSLAAYLYQMTDSPVSLQIAIDLYTAVSSPAANQTRMAVIAQGGYVRRAGQLTTIPLGKGAHTFDFPGGKKTIVPIPSGEIETLYYTTRIPDITVHGVLPINPTIARLILPVAQRLTALPAIQRRLQQRVTKQLLPAVIHVDEDKKSYVYASMKDARGNNHSAWLETGEGYDFTAKAAVLAVEQVLANHHQGGAKTPGLLLGPDFVLRIPNTRRFERR